MLPIESSLLKMCIEPAKPVSGEQIVLANFEDEAKERDEAYHLHQLRLSCVLRDNDLRFEQSMNTLIRVIF